MNCQRFLRENFLASIWVLGCLIQEWESTSEPVEPSSHSAAVYCVRDAIPKLEANPACAPFLVLPRHPGYGECRGEYRLRVRAAQEDLEACPPYEIDQRNRRYELALSVDAILRELGLAELLEGC